MRAISACLGSGRSTMASSTQSASPTARSKSSSRLPRRMRAAADSPNRFAGRAVRIRSKPVRTMRLRTSGLCSVRPAASSCGVSEVGVMSSKWTASPAFARWPAMAAPMVPAPMTVTLWIACGTVLRPFASCLRADELIPALRCVVVYPTLLTGSSVAWLGSKCTSASRDVGHRCSNGFLQPRAQFVRVRHGQRAVDVGFQRDEEPALHLAHVNPVRIAQVIEGVDGAPRPGALRVAAAHCSRVRWAGSPATPTRCAC